MQIRDFQSVHGFQSIIEKQTGKKIKNIRTDNGGEYISGEFIKFCEREGIKHEYTIAYTPEQNGVAERMNRTLTEKAECFLFDADLEKQFWAEAVSTMTRKHLRRHFLNKSVI